MEMLSLEPHGLLLPKAHLCIYGYSILENALEHLTKNCSQHNHFEINTLTVRPEPVEGLNGYMPTIQDVHGSTLRHAQDSPRTSPLRGCKKMLHALEAPCSLRKRHALYKQLLPQLGMAQPNAGQGWFWFIVISKRTAINSVSLIERLTAICFFQCPFSGIKSCSGVLRCQCPWHNSMPLAGKHNGLDPHPAFLKCFPIV
jgi:hypothetical protein